MQVTAKLSYLRIAPRKVRLVADMVRGRPVEEAKNILQFVVKKATLPFLKLLKSAVANAKNNFHLEEENLYISKVLVGEGPKLKRWIARARGKADEIQKKTSHITIVLGEIKKGVAAEKYVKKEEGVKKEEKGAKRIEKAPKAKKEKLRPVAGEAPKPKKERETKKVFRRTVF